jgi:hypothetical protein
MGVHSALYLQECFVSAHNYLSNDYIAVRSQNISVLQIPHS